MNLRLITFNKKEYVQLICEVDITKEGCSDPFHPHYSQLAAPCNTIAT